MIKPNSVIKIPSSLDGSFFRYWMDFLKPFHKLTERESDVFVAFLRNRYELSLVIKDQGVLDKVLMSEDTKKKIREECGITLPHFQVIMGKLRKTNLVIDGRLNPKFIPNITSDEGFKLMLYFDFK